MKRITVFVFFFLFSGFLQGAQQQNIEQELERMVENAYAEHYQRASLTANPAFLCPKISSYFEDSSFIRNESSRKNMYDSLLLLKEYVEGGLEYYPSKENLDKNDLHENIDFVIQYVKRFTPMNLDYFRICQKKMRHICDSLRGAALVRTAESLPEAEQETESPRLNTKKKVSAAKSILASQYFAKFNQAIAVYDNITNPQKKIEILQIIMSGFLDNISKHFVPINENFFKDKKLDLSLLVGNAYGLFIPRAVTI